jgi:spore coat protein CotF
MHHDFGAHEIVEAHEVLTSTIDGINIFSLLRRHVSDQQLGEIMDRQLSFAEKEYNDMVSFMSNRHGINADTYHARRTPSINYGLRSPQPVSPHETAGRLTDRDVASIMLNMHKCSASRKMMASLECADSQLRHMMMQGAMSCAEKAYEIFTYMNQKGMYQVPTMQDKTQMNFINTFQPIGNTGIPSMMRSAGTFENRGFIS